MDGRPLQSSKQKSDHLYLSRRYTSDFDWGIIMDDHAVLMQETHRNSSDRLFAEMAVKGKAANDGVNLLAYWPRSNDGKLPLTKSLMTE